jgi:hypothetical protein
MQTPRKNLRQIFSLSKFLRKLFAIDRQSSESGDQKVLEERPPILRYYEDPRNEFEAWTILPFKSFSSLAGWFFISLPNWSRDDATFTLFQAAFWENQFGRRHRYLVAIHLLFITSSIYFLFYVLYSLKWINRRFQKLFDATAFLEPLKADRSYQSRIGCQCRGATSETWKSWKNRNNDSVLSGHVILECLKPSIPRPRRIYCSICGSILWAQVSIGQDLQIEFRLKNLGVQQKSLHLSTFVNRIRKRAGLTFLTLSSRYRFNMHWPISWSAAPGSFTADRSPRHFHASVNRMCFLW